jgi:hypothetical protein
VAGSACRKIPAKSGGTHYGYVMYRSYHACSSESGSKGQQTIWMQLLIRRKNILVANNTWTKIIEHTRTFRLCIMWPSTERQWFIVFHIWQSNGHINTSCQGERIGHFDNQNYLVNTRCHTLEMSVHGFSTMIRLAFWMIQTLGYNTHS